MKTVTACGNFRKADMQQIFDVLVVGGGNAALCSAITAAESGAKVLVLESAPFESRGGNSRHTRNARYLHERGNHHLSGPYLEEEFWEDLLQVTGGQTNEQLARFTIRESRNLGEWMEKWGVVFQPSMRGTLSLSRTNAFFLGGGKALMNAYYAAAARLGVVVVYGAEVMDLDIRDGEFISAEAVIENLPRRVFARNIVLASGGFEANLEWLKQYWGDAADNFIIRGTPYDRGRMLQVMLDKGAKPVGDSTQCHAVAIDARAPKDDGGIVTRLDCVPFGIVVNKDAKRFNDEGENFWPKRYAVWGRMVAGQPDQIAYSLIDSKSIDLFMPSVFPPIEAGSIRELAVKLELDPAALEETVRVFNDSTRPGTFDHSVLDDCATVGIDPPKSHWARPLDSPPFYGYPLRPGITFTYLGVTVDEHARVIMQDDRPAKNIFAAGEIMAGNILGKGYMAGFGMTIGTVFGRIAGREAGAQRAAHGEEVLHAVSNSDRSSNPGAISKATADRTPSLLSRILLQNDGVRLDASSVRTTADEPLTEADRVMTICNACRYCEGFCAVFPAMELRRTFSTQDLKYLANLCHNCRDCYYACQYVPPHEFDLNVPKSLGELRLTTYEEFSWPESLKWVFRRNGLAVFSTAVLSIAVMVMLTLFARGAEAFFKSYQGAGSFYRIVPYWILVPGFSAVVIFVIAALLKGTRRLLDEIGGLADNSGGRKQNAFPFPALPVSPSVFKAAWHALRLKYLSAGGHGCNYPDDRFRMIRRNFHHAVFYGFVLCFAATTVAAVYDHILGLAAPYPFFSLPVLLGTTGGFAIMIGTAGLLYLKTQMDVVPSVTHSLGMDVGFSVLLFLTVSTGFLLLLLRSTPLMGLMLTVHLGFVLGLFLTMPYGKFIHSVYRYMALVRNAAEQSAGTTLTNEK